MLSVFMILIILALVFTVLAIAVPAKYPLLNVAVLLACIALLIGGGRG